MLETAPAGVGMGGHRRRALLVRVAPGCTTVTFTPNFLSSAASLTSSPCWFTSLRDAPRSREGAGRHHRKVAMPDSTRQVHRSEHRIDCPRRWIACELAGRACARLLLRRARVQALGRRARYAAIVSHAVLSLTITIAVCVAYLPMFVFLSLFYMVIFGISGRLDDFWRTRGETIERAACAAADPEAPHPQ